MELSPFQLEERIGQGAMGEVWRARHRRSGTPAALKVITRQYASRETYRRRFRNEIRSAAALNHPGIVRIYDYGEIDRDAAASSGLELRPNSPYFAMELADSGSVDALESEVGWPELRGLLVGLLQSLGHAHARSVFHRDLKPSNILLGTDRRGRSRYKISDFGLAFDRERGFDEEETGDGPVGTPHYMAPEQLRSRHREIGPWTDLYSLGCMVWRLTTGTSPFRGDTLLEVARSHLAEPLPEFEPRFDVPADFEPWLARLLEKHPHDRFRQAAGALWKLLEMPETLEAQSSAPIEVDDRSTMARTTVTEPLESLAADTRLEPEAPIETPEPRETMAPDHSGDPPRSTEPVDRALPPVPADWAQRRAPVGSLPQMTAGRELYSLREFPMVGREEERDALWRALREVVADQSAKLVLLRGDAGVGKTRLVRWLGRRAEEVGAARALSTAHDPETREGGLSELMASEMALHGLDREEAVDRADTWYAARGVDRDYEPRAAAEYVVGSGRAEATGSTMDQWGSGDETGPLGPESDDTPEHVRFSSVQEIRALVRRFLECAAEERPLVVGLDDLQWGLETVHFLDYLFGTVHVDDLPVLFVATVRDDALAERPLEQETVGELRDLDRAETVALEAMSDDDQRFLVEELLHMAPEAAERVVDRAGGNPEFAVELVRDWIDRDLLEPTERGFALADETDPQIPENLYEIWRDRLSDLLGDCDERPRTALQLGAILGEEIDEEEWRSACEAAGFPFPDRLLPLLLRHNLLRETDGGWRFAHSLLRETLLRRVDEAERSERLHRACAEVVPRDADDPEAAERLARLLDGADRRVDALEHLVDAGLRRSYRKEETRAKLLYRRAEELAESMDPDDRPYLMARLALLEGRVRANVDFDYDRADEAFDRSRRRAESAGDSDLVARALVGRAMDANQRDEMTEILHWTRRALEHAGDGSLAAARAHLYRACARDARGEFDRARRAFERGIEIARGRSPLEELKLLMLYGRTLRHASKPDQAREQLQKAVRLGRRLADRWILAETCNELGDISRAIGDADRARKWFRRAEHYANLVDQPGLFPCFLGRPHLDLESGNYTAARRRLVALRQRTEGRRRHWFEVALTGLEAQADCGLGDWERADERSRRVEQLIDEHVPMYPDGGELIAGAARFALEADQRTLAGRLGRAALRIWSQLDDERADALADQLRDRDVPVDAA